MVVCMLVAQSCLTFCVPMDCSPPGSSVHGLPGGKWKGNREENYFSLSGEMCSEGK